MNKQGQFLTEVIFEFKATVNIKICELFLDDLITLIKVEQTNRFVNLLPPGFDILCSLKESCIYLGCWPEYEYNRLIVSSCKQFNHKEIIPLIKENFILPEKIKVTVNSDESIEQKVKKLWQ